MAEDQILRSSIEHLHGLEEVPYGEDELVAVCLVRDGRPYVRSFVEHYRSLGVKHIVFLDNGSTDGTVEALKSYDDVTVLRSKLPYKEYKFSFKQYLITRFGWGRWILCVDIDELFDYPYSDVVDLSSFLRYLTKKSYTAVVGQMLDMFPEKPLLHTAASKDEPLKELHRFYEISNIIARDYYPTGSVNTLASDEIKLYRDGIFDTLFGHRTWLTKHPLMFLDDQIRPIDSSTHWVSRARVADVTCVLFHYKFAGGFYQRVLRAVEEENYANNSYKYKTFLKTLEQNSELQIKREETTPELRDVNDLVDNQFLVVSGDYMAWVDAEERKSGGGEPRRLVEAFSKASARARTKVIEVRNLERRVEKLENSLIKERRRAERSLAKERQRNQKLERQVHNIWSSRSWKLLSKLGRIRDRMPGKG